mmetsp:Transcript_29106/g.53177  ORF Transcript_29106/g.53177 Transcript_29106/m.53177 type:complete len:462 (-) Transcript_29106:247-1632(-)
MQQVFEKRAEEIESLLPAIHFTPGTGDLELALTAISNLLAGPSFEPYYMKIGLDELFSKTRAPSDPLLILCNIRRWALDGLQDKNLILKLERQGRLFAPSPTDKGPRTTSRSCSITAKQARCILANAFIGNCIDRMAAFKDERNYGGLDFRFAGPAKMECLLTYFDVCGSLEGTDDDERVITFDLISFTPLSAEYFQSSRVRYGNHALVGKGVTLHTGTMESPSRKYTAFINFANPNYGYGKFTRSCTQEEILLMCCPELMVGMLFLGKMKDNQVVNVNGVRRFCKYSGYLNSFKCEGPLDSTDEQPISTILTLDACYDGHFTEAMLWRDLSKAYFSFLGLTAGSKHHEGSYRPVVSTGKWGCGAFGGLPAHKMLQQAVAAAAAGVDLEFSSFGSYEGCDKVIVALRETRPSVAKVINLLQNCKSRRTFVCDAVRFLHDEQVASQGQTTAKQISNMQCDWV